jgi:hypothetical protein
MTPNPHTGDELGIAPDPYTHHDQTDYVPDDYDEPRPTPKQLAYLRALANRTGQTFAYPRTAAQASREIRRLKSTPASSRTEVRIERKQIADAIAAGPADSAAVRVDEVSGHGSTATWAHNRDREPAGPSKPAPKRPAPKVGPRTELARYTIAGQARVLFGQRVDGVVRLTDCPTGAGERSYLVERGLEQDGNSALKALIADYLDQAERHQTIPVLVDADRYLAHVQ